jgi:hypothetical protein
MGVGQKSAWAWARNVLDDVGSSPLKDRLPHVWPLAGICLAVEVNSVWIIALGYDIGSYFEGQIGVKRASCRAHAPTGFAAAIT